MTSRLVAALRRAGAAIVTVLLLMPPAVALARDFGPVGTVIPLTPDEQQILVQKLEVAAEEERTTRSSLGSADLVSCPSLAEAPIEPMNVICTPYYGYLTTEWRAQTKYYYCGPTAVQVVSNYAWDMPSGTNKYSQSYISSTWTKTTTSGTTVSRVRVGLNGAASGHLPPGFVYVEYLLPKADNSQAVQQQSGRDWHNKLRTDINVYEMPQVLNVAPHDPGAQYWLKSWPTAVDAGHYVVADGWEAVWDGVLSNAYPTVRYDDGSADYSGGSGQFNDNARSVFYTIWIHHRYIIW